MSGWTNICWGRGGGGEGRDTQSGPLSSRDASVSTTSESPSLSDHVWVKNVLVGDRM